MFIGLGLWWLTPLSTIFQLHRGCHLCIHISIKTCIHKCIFILINKKAGKDTFSIFVQFLKNKHYTHICFSFGKSMYKTVYPTYLTEFRYTLNTCQIFLNIFSSGVNSWHITLPLCVWPKYEHLTWHVTETCIDRVSIYTFV